MGKRFTISVFAFLAVLLVTYTAGYVWLGRTVKGSISVGRIYPRPWMRTAYAPCAWAEAKLGQYTVYLHGGEGTDKYDP